MSTPLESLLPLLAQLVGSDGEFKSLADLAAQDGRSPFHLQRLFRTAIGESPLQYSRRVRLQRAAASLLVTEKSVLDVALDAGFDSHEGFSRAFRSRFDISPQAFRAQREVFERLVRQYHAHLEIAHRSAPCVGLYRASLDKPSHNPIFGGVGMNYTVTKKTVDETPFLFMRRQVKPEGIAEAFGEMFGSVFQFATAQGISFAGPPTARYPSFGPGLITIEAGMPVAGSAVGEGAIQRGFLVGGEVATTVHKGTYEALHLGHEAIQAWLTENDEEARGAPWETYVTDPGEVPDPTDWLTEIVWPINGPCRSAQTLP